RLTPSDLDRIPPSGKLVATLFQTTRALDNSRSGSVNITRDPFSRTLHLPHLQSHAATPRETLTRDPNVSVLPLSSLLIPSSLNLMASETWPPLGLNITQELIDGHNFNMAAAMLTASGVVSEFEADEAGAGITLFVPTDAAFRDLPSSVRLQSLAADQKAIVLKFHVLHSYYPLGTLESIVIPIYPTLATEQNWAGRFTVNISRVNGSVAIDTGLVLASVTQWFSTRIRLPYLGCPKFFFPESIHRAESGCHIWGVQSFASQRVFRWQWGDSCSPPPDIAAPSSHLQAPPVLEQASGALRISMAWWGNGIDATEVEISSHFSDWDSFKSNNTLCMEAQGLIDLGNYSA
ncbi:fasciclin-like arabinogalactan family protein, partial [Striga asiatica]